MSSSRLSLTNWLRFLFFFFWVALFCSQSAMDVASTLIALTAIVDLARSRERLIAALKAARCSWLTYLFVAWIIVIAAGLFGVAPPEAPRWTNLLEFRWMFELGLWFQMLKHAPPRRTDLPWLMGLTVLNAAYGLLAFLFHRDFLADLVNPAAPGSAPVIYDRVGGLIGNPMPFAQSMGPVAAALLAGGLVWWSAGRKISASYVVGTLLVSLAVLFSYTRGIWIGVFTAALVVPPLVFPRRGWALSLAAVVGAFALAFVPPIHERITQAFDPTRSYDGERVVLWQTNWKIFKDHPVVGAGYGENRRRLREYYDRDGIPKGQFESHAHNQYLHFLAGTGVLGLLCYLLFLSFFLVESVKQVLHRSGDLWIDAGAAGLLAAQIVFDVGSFSESNFSIAKNRMFILLLFAVVLLFRTVRRAGGTPMTTRPDGSSR